MKQPSTPLFSRLRSQPHPAGTDICSDLIDYHTQRPGATEATYGQCTTADGKTSYELLATSAGDLTDAVVIDLACGNGPLTECLFRCHPGITRVIGIDLCAADLALATARTRGHPVEYRCESALQLSVATASVDVVLCHLAFMLFNPLEPAIAEVVRVLKSNGRFSCVSASVGQKVPLFTEIGQTLQALVAQSLPHLQAFGWGDPRALSETGLRALLVHATAFRTLYVQEFLLRLIDTPDRLAKRLLGYFYSTDLLNADAQSILVAQWTTLFQHHADADSQAMLEFPLSLFTAMR